MIERETQKQIDKLNAKVTEKDTEVKYTEIALLREQIAALKEQMISRREHRFVDVIPDEGLVERILSTYIEDGFTTDNTVGFPPENPLCKLMNETQEKRNRIIRKAIETLRGKEET